MNNQIWSCQPGRCIVGVEQSVDYVGSANQGFHVWFL